MENISKIVLTKTGKKIGFVLDVAIDFDTMEKQGFIVVDELTEEEFLLKRQSILSSSTKYILVEDETILEFCPQHKTFFGKEIMDESCQSYGFLREIVFKKNKCHKFVTQKCEILAKNIVCVGEDFIFAQFHRKKKLTQKKPFMRVDEALMVGALDFKKPIVPEVVRLSSSFYVGKISSQDIFGYNNERIVAKGEVVTSGIVKKAKVHNKLNQLYFATR